MLESSVAISLSAEHPLSMADVRGSRDVGRFLAVRFIWGLSVIWLALSFTWLMVQLRPTTRGPLGGSPGGSGETDPDLLTAYLTWLADYLTLQWGQGVIETWLSAGTVTLAYLLPAALLAALIGVGLATYGAIHPDGWIDRSVSALSYLGVSIPTFVLAEAILVIGVEQFGTYTVFRPNQPLLAIENVIGLMLPTALLAVLLLAVVARYARNESLSHLNKEFVKTARSKGAGRLRIAAHITRNAWLALAQVMFSETLGLVFLGTIVLEEAFSIPGIGVAVFRAFVAPDGPLIVSAVLVAVIVAVLGTWIQDIGRVFLMPDETD